MFKLNNTSEAVTWSAALLIFSTVGMFATALYYAPSKSAEIVYSDPVYILMNSIRNVSAFVYFFTILQTAVKQKSYSFLHSSVHYFALVILILYILLGVQNVLS